MADGAEQDGREQDGAEQDGRDSIFIGLGADGQKARHARSTIGGMASADDMARLIDRALGKRQRWLLPEPVSRFGSLLWRLAPALYLRAVRKKFAGDIYTTASSKKGTVT